MISELSSHSTPLPIGFRTWLWRYACLLLMSMLWQRQAIFESKGGKLYSSAECRIRSQGLWNRISSRMNAHWQTNWAIDDQAKNLNSIGRSHGQRAFIPLDPTAGWLRTWLWPYTCLLLLISMLWHRQAKGDKLSYSHESRIRTQDVWNGISSRLGSKRLSYRGSS